MEIPLPQSAPSGAERDLKKAPSAAAQSEDRRAFTYDAFRELITAFRERGYEFVGFAEPALLMDRAEPFALLRHDIDFDLDAAVRMAEIEAGEGVRATYFFLLRTSMYNVLSAEGSDAINRIKTLGHWFGLHFDCAAYPPEITVPDLAGACAREAAVFEDWFGVKTEIVSNHRPNKVVLSGDPALSAPRRHTYMPEYTRAIQYVSDSQGAWRYGSPTETAAFQDSKPLHILIHPIWWRETPLAAYETLEDFRGRRMDRLELTMARSCKVYRRGRFAEITD